MPGAQTSKVLWPKVPKFRNFFSQVILRDLQINELHMSVSDMKGKFIKPTLKKVSKYENKFAKLQEKAAKFAFANQLKSK